MRPLGFSTGALAHADFRRALAMLKNTPITALELSALREHELDPLLAALDSLDLSAYRYISIHAPSAFLPDSERDIHRRLLPELHRGWPIVLHPDAITDFGPWRDFGPLLCLENMDKRKPIGRTAAELETLFRQLPDATFCFDIGHARQIDPTMIESYLILRDFAPRLRQVHVSEVSSRSRHDVLSFCSTSAFQRVAHMIPAHIPLILETPVAEGGIAAELRKVQNALPVREQAQVA